MIEMKTVLTHKGIKLTTLYYKMAIHYTLPLWVECIILHYLLIVKDLPLEILATTN